MILAVTPVAYLPLLPAAEGRDWIRSGKEVISSSEIALCYPQRGPRVLPAPSPPSPNTHPSLQRGVAEPRTRGSFLTVLSTGQLCGRGMWELGSLA